MKFKRMFLFYMIPLFFSCSSDAQPKGLSVGDKAPQIFAKTISGENISLAELLKKGPVVLNFYRGAWCPYCTKHMFVLEDSLKYISALGGSVIAVTPEKPENAIELVKETKASFAIISDDKNEIMDAYKVTFTPGFFARIYHKLHCENLEKWNASGESKLPVPATYIISQDGKIFARHFIAGNHKDRMSVNEILSHLEAIKNKK